MDLPGNKLAALVAGIPGVVTVLMATVKRDWSTVLVGAVCIYTGYWLWTWRKRQALMMAAAEEKS